MRIPFQWCILTCNVLTYRFYDTTKFSPEDARVLSAMDLIPKDAMKKSDENQQRAKRLKRTTTESANVAGYYRFKNEGVEVLSYAKEVTTKVGLRNKKPQPSHKDNHDSGTIFSSILKAPKNLPPMPPKLNEKALPRKQGNRMEFLAGLRQNLLKVRSFQVGSSVSVCPSDTFPNSIILVAGSSPGLSDFAEFESNII